MVETTSICVWKLIYLHVIYRSVLNLGRAHCSLRRLYLFSIFGGKTWPWPWPVVRDLFIPLAFANRQKLSASFGCRISLWTKVFYIVKVAEIMCSILHPQIWLRTPIERVVFSDCWRISNAQSFSHLPNKILCDPSSPPPTGFFATQILGGNVTSRNQGLSSNDQGRQRRETLGTRLFTSMDCPNEESDDVNTESLEIL